MAPQKEFESPTFRLGGGRSILLSYWGMCVFYSNQKKAFCQGKQMLFKIKSPGNPGDSFYISCRPSSALDRVTSSAYSSWLPTGTP